MTAEKNTWPGWECVKKLGAGAYGSVYEIRRVENGVEYKAALKVISIPKNSDEMADATIAIGLDLQSTPKYYQSIVDNIKREVELLSTLKGRTNIVSYEDHMVIPHEDGVGADIYIRMELLTPLYQYMRIRQWSTMPEQEVVRLGCDICKALEICEKKQIIHRDIKPENIFVNEDGDFVLGDFGIARTLEKSVAASTRIGTESYMAPEVFKGLKYDSRADIYSLGLVLYRFLNKNRDAFMPLPPEVPLALDRSQAFERRLKGEQIPTPADGTPELKKVILKAIVHRPEDRYGKASEFRMALGNCMMDTEPSPHLEPSPQSVKKRVKKKKMIMATVLAVLACIVISVVGVGMLQGKILHPVSDQPVEDTATSSGQMQETTDDSEKNETSEFKLVCPQVITVGDSAILHIQEANGLEVSDIEATAASWKVNDMDVLSVTAGGKVSAKKVGTATLTVEYNGKTVDKQIIVADDSAAQDIEVVSEETNSAGDFVLDLAVNEDLPENIEWSVYVSSDSDELIKLSGNEIYQKELTLYQPSSMSERNITIVVVSASNRTQILARRCLKITSS